MTELVNDVKKNAGKLRNWAHSQRMAKHDSTAERLDGFASVLETVSEELVRLYGLTTALPADLGNIHDLPPELLEELSVAKTDELEDQLVTVIKAYGDEASLDQVLVGLYRKFEVIQKRRFIQNKLYRMDTVWSVPGKKGVYTTTEPEGKSEKPAVDEGYNPFDTPSDEIPF